MKVVICGSRNYKDCVQFKNEIDRILHELFSTNIVVNKSDITIISGGAAGADEFAKIYANWFEYNLNEYPADWSQYGKKAGILRNLTMLEIADLVIAFYDGSSPGTTHMVKECKKRDIPLIIINI